MKIFKIWPHRLAVKLIALVFQNAPVSPKLSFSETLHLWACLGNDCVILSESTQYFKRLFLFSKIFVYVLGYHSLICLDA